LSAVRRITALDGHGMARNYAQAMKVLVINVGSTSIKYQL
jgi:hypothetical protein